MIRLTVAEAAVVRSVLAATPMLEKDRIRESSLSPRTYETARRRLFERRVVIERYVPNPVSFGVPRVMFRVYTGTGEECAELRRGWARGEGCGVLWSSDSFSLSVSFEPDLAPGNENPPPSRPRLCGGRTTEIAVDLRASPVPVYFDFGGEWTQIIGSHGTPGYPHGLPSGPDDRGEQANSQPSSVWRAAQRLVRGSEGDAIYRGQGFHLGSLFRDGQGSRAIQAGLVERRGFLNLVSQPEVGVWRLQEVVFVLGRPKTQNSAENLYQRLVAERLVRPFLYVADRRAVLLAALSPVPSRQPSETRGSNLTLLREHLSEIGIHRVRVEQLQIEVDHRYSDLVNARLAQK